MNPVFAVRHLEKRLKEQLKDCMEYFRAFAMHNLDYKEIINGNPKKDAVRVTRSGLVAGWAADRLEGKDIDTPDQWRAALEDTELDWDLWGNIRMNDGHLTGIAEAFKAVGDMKNALLAESCIYKGDMS
jgi:hypothetical protein